ncbi:winged helix-turn-helix transcriptional regulator [Pseudoflavonifractor capillosus]|uniref:winged helix-turn-helix transcriptional regulator n=1 Tax=Pseudoflavonifractor capillosus TaxID=106588 RepID=UPI00195C5083|nr:helix-turn-helix domain-containing protein [Pseudoflavonifractor capillosus]MBM6680141.1 helix-turn-helix transcriptional regulator [Pseudoflavonifractor capillosus]
MDNPCISGAYLGTTGFSYTLSLINGKYKMPVLYTLMNYGTVRFNEIKRYIGTISYKTLSTTLKELEADQLVHREEYPQIPPKVEYSLTERGKSLIPILEGMCAWGGEHRLPSLETPEEQL